MASYRHKAIQPIGWNSHRLSHCYKSVKPVNKICTHLLLHKNVPRNFLPHYGHYEKPEADMVMVNTILNHQKARCRTFLCMKEYSGREPPAIIRASPFNSKVSTPRPCSVCQNDEGAFILPGLDLKKVGASVSPRRVKEMVQRLAKYDPQRIPESKGVVYMPIAAPIKRQSKYTPEQVNAMVSRLARANMETSRRIAQRSPMGKAKRRPVTQKEVSEKINEIVNRLTTFDQTRFPAESRGKLKFSSPPAVVQFKPQYTYDSPELVKPERERFASLRSVSNEKNGGSSSDSNKGLKEGIVCWANGNHGSQNSSVAPSGGGNSHFGSRNSLNVPGGDGGSHATDSGVNGCSLASID